MGSVFSKPSRSRNNPVTIGRERLAGSCSSNAGTRTCATITAATDRAIAEVLSLPMYAELTDAQIVEVTTAIKELLAA